MMVSRQPRPARHGVHGVDRRAPRHHQRRVGARPRGDDPDGACSRTAARSDIVTPGHVFPLRARARRRAGAHRTDRGRRRSVAPRRAAAGVGDLRDHERGRQHGAAAPTSSASPRVTTLKICTIADLIQYRLRCDSLVHRVAEATLPTRYGGDFKAYVYHTDVDEGEHLVLVRGDDHARRADPGARPRRVPARRRVRLGRSRHRRRCCAARWR